jgi:hypothetical protein
MKKHVILLAVLAVLCYHFNASGEDGWKLKKRTDGIIIHTRPVAGSPLEEFRAECTINAPLEKIARILNEPENFIYWFSDVKYCRVLRDQGDTKLLYLIIHTPWPVKNRDVIVETTLSCDLKACRTRSSVQSVDSTLVPTDEKMVRMPNLSGTFTLISINENSTSVTYNAHADPGLALPEFLLNYFALNQPLQTLKGLRRMATAGK